MISAHCGKGREGQRPQTGNSSPSCMGEFLLGKTKKIWLSPRCPQRLHIDQNIFWVKHCARVESTYPSKEKKIQWLLLTSISPHTECPQHLKHKVQGEQG